MGAARSKRPRGDARPRPARKGGAVVHAVRPIVDELAEVHDLEVWDVEFVREAGRETLRVSLDQEGGIAAGVLTTVSEQLSRRLDEDDVVPGDDRYWLEVTTPGAERKLGEPRQFRICRGRAVRLTFKDGREPLVGEIGEVGDTEVEIRTEDGAQQVRFDGISQARLSLPGV